jgi:hypothetical protein
MGIDWKRGIEGTQEAETFFLNWYIEVEANTPLTCETIQYNKSDKT